MNKKKIIIVICATILVVIGSYFGYKNWQNSKREAEQNTVIGNQINFDTNICDGCSISNGVATITNNGTYTVIGTVSEGYIDVKVDGEVNLVLDNTSITSQNDAAIKAESGTLLKITLADNSINSVTGGGTEYDAAISGMIPIVIEGNGTLNVNGTKQEGISTKAQDITINGGVISVTSIDDGINAGGDGGLITINAGTIYIDANGDGIDSNQDLIINGGTLFVMGSSEADNAGIDTDGKYQINGGTVVAVGNGMMQAPDADSSQKTILFNLDSSIKSETIVALSDGTDTLVFKATKDFKTLTISTPTFTKNAYHLYTGGSYSGIVSNGYYISGTYTNGDAVTVDNNSEFYIDGITNWYGNNNNMEGAPTNMGGIRPQA